MEVKNVAIQIIIVDCDFPSFSIQWLSVANYKERIQRKLSAFHYLANNKENGRPNYYPGVSKHAIQVVIMICDAFVIQFMTTICGKHHKQAQETYKANKAWAIQIIIVYCDSFVIQYTMTNLWRKILAQALELNRNSLLTRRPRKSHSGCQHRLWLSCHSVYDDNLWQNIISKLENHIKQTKQKPFRFLSYTVTLLSFSVRWLICGGRFQHKA